MDGQSERVSPISALVVRTFIKMPETRRPVSGVLLAALLAVGLLLPTVGRGQAMGKAVIEGPSPWPAAAAAVPEKPVVDNSGKTEPLKAIPEAAVARSVSPVQVVATNLGAAAPVAPKPEVKEPVRAPAVAAAAVEPKTPEAVTPVVDKTADKILEKMGGGTPVAGAESPKATNSIELSAIRGNTPEAPKTGATDTASKGTGWSGLGGLAQTGAALAIVIGLILIGRALARKFVPGAGASNGKGVIEILARHPLAKNQSIVLVRIGSQIVALNQGKESSESVLVISDAGEVARIIGQIEGKNPNSIQAGFNKLLANARMDLEEGNGDENAGNAKAMGEDNLDEQLEEMAAAKRQLMELRQHVRSVRDSLPRE